MRALMIAAAVAALTCSISAPGQAQTAQQTLMKSCNSDAAAKKLAGDTRKSFMADCLAGKTQTSQTPSAPPTSTAATQQQRMKDCNANATGQKLKGAARKDFMSSCLSGGAAAGAPAAAPSGTAASTPAAQTTAQSPQAAQQQRMKDCNANATSQKLKGNARKDFMGSCLSTGAAASAPAPTTSVPPATAAKPEEPAATRTTVAPGAPVQPRQPSTSGSAPSTAALGPGQYATEAQAKSTCAADTVVWVNTESHIYHFKNAADFGKTKQGAYMCEREAVTGGSRAAKNEKRS